MSEIYVCEKTLANQLGLADVKVDGVSENLISYLTLMLGDNVDENAEAIKLLEQTMILNRSEQQKYFNSLEFVQSIFPNCLIARGTFKDQEYILMKVSPNSTPSPLIPIDAELFPSKELADEHFNTYKQKE